MNLGKRVEELERRSSVRPLPQSDDPKDFTDDQLAAIIYGIPEARAADLTDEELKIRL